MFVARALIPLAMVAAMLMSTACKPTAGGNGCSFKRPAAAAALVSADAAKPEPKAAKTRTEA